MTVGPILLFQPIATGNCYHHRESPKEAENMNDVRWDIRRKDRAWNDNEAEDRYFSAPEKMGMVDGKLYEDDEQRLHMLALLLENVGADAAIRLGDPQVWRVAIAELYTTDAYSSHCHPDLGLARESLRPASRILNRYLS
jgi:hypothetical protein